MNEEETTCPHCGAKIKKWWHRLTPGLVGCLVKAIKLVHQKNENIVSLAELDLSHTEYTNFYKLRLHGLIAKYRIDGEWQRGKWLITKRGAQFLADRLAVPVRVETLRNKVVGHDEVRLYIHEIMSSDLPEFDGYQEYVNSTGLFGEIDVEDETGELKQQDLFQP